MTEAELGLFAEGFIKASNADRRKLISRVLEVSSDDPTDFDLTTIAMHLRDQGNPDWAEALFMLAAAIPHQKDIAELQLAILWSLSGKLDHSLALFERIMSNNALASSQKTYIARQFARKGNFSAARRLISEAFGQEKGEFNNGLVEFQFANFLEEFPLEMALELDSQIKSSYSVASYAETLGQIKDALTHRRPYALIRLGDGEGINLRLSAEDESKYSILYSWGREQIHQIWYSASALMDNVEFLHEMFKVQRAYKNADSVSILHELGLRHEYMIGSPRGIPALVNIYRYFLDIKQGGNFPSQICESTIHRSLLIYGGLSEILPGRDFVGIVSCYDQLPHLLKSTFGIEEITLAQTCGEYVSRQHVLGEKPDDDLANFFLSNHFDICAQLESIRPGELYLVAAGIFGKIYCDLIKRGGGIALDIGSVADIWMGVSTRGFTDEEKSFCLVR